MDTAQPGRAISRDISKGEMVEAEIDAFISKRASQDRRPNRDEQEELWKESVRRYNARRREQNRAARCDYFSRLAWSLRARAAEYDERAQTLRNGELES